MLKKILTGFLPAVLITVVLAACGGVPGGLDLPRVIDEAATATPAVSPVTAAPAVRAQATATPAKIPAAWETFREVCEASGQMRAKLNADGMSCEPIGQLPAPTEVPKAIAATAVPTATTVPPTATPKEIKPAGPMTGKLFLSPVTASSTFNQESAWLIAEPGVICTPECPWTVMAVDAPYWGNAPEGGFLYISAGQITLDVDNVKIDLSYKEKNNYLVLIRGRIDDGKVDTDLNTRVKITNFVAGHGIFSYLRPGAYVSKGWFLQQLEASSNVKSASSSFTNCGALGCSITHVVLYDIDSHAFQMFKVNANDLTNWQQPETNIK